MLASHLKPKQKIIYWSPTLKRYVLQTIKVKGTKGVTLSNGVRLTYKKILCIQGAN